MDDAHVRAAERVLHVVEEQLLPKPLLVDSSAAMAAGVLDLKRRKNGQIVGLPWPSEWPALARRLGPIEPASLSIIAARPSVGKTMMGLHLCRSLAGEGKRVLFVSRELSVVRLMRRHWTSYGANMMNLRLGKPTAADTKAIATFEVESSRWELYYDVHSKTVAEVRQCADELRPDVIIIDYLQRLAYDTEKEYAAITRIVNELQDVTLETSVPVVCLSQLSRPMKGFEWKPPSMTDTRGSGAVEERAANLVLLHRRWVMDDDEKDGKKSSVPRSMTEDGFFIVAKCADGETGTAIPVLFNGARMCISEKL